VYYTLINSATKLLAGRLQEMESRHLSASPEIIPPFDSDLKVPTVLGTGALVHFGVKGGDLTKVFDFFSGRVRQNPNDAGLQLDLALLYLLTSRPDEAYHVQAQALAHQHLFRVVGTRGREVATRKRVLAFVAPGDFTNNAQIEFLLDGSDIGLDVLYLVPGEPLPPSLPEHDVAFCAVNESDENLPTLRRLAQLIPHWPRPVVNDPDKVSRLSRTGVAELLEGDSTICTPKVSRVPAAGLDRLARGEVSLDSVLPAFSFPVLVRPVGSHSGRNLEKIDNLESLASYLKKFEARPNDFFVTAFVDYRSADGLYRKYRLVFIEGAPFICHMGISDQWMIHYANVGMSDSLEKRGDEAAAMETFDRNFACRHEKALANLAKRIGLDYFVLDCGESPDGRLLIFEADIAMVVHAMDSPTLFPYKQQPMAKVFAAFGAAMDRASLRPPGLPKG
jgi:hypothetical protein